MPGVAEALEAGLLHQRQEVAQLLGGCRRTGLLTEAHPTSLAASAGGFEPRQRWHPRDLRRAPDPAPASAGQRRALPLLVRRRRRARLQRDAGARRVVRPLRGGRRLHRPVDGHPRQGARPDQGRGAAGGRDHRMGSLRAQRRLHGVEPHPRRGQRPGALPLRAGGARADGPPDPRRHRGRDRALRDRLRLRAHRGHRHRDRAATSSQELAERVRAALLARPGRRAARRGSHARRGRLPHLPRRAVAQGPSGHRRPGPAGLGPQGRGRVARRADLRAHQGHQARARRHRRAGAHALRQGPGRDGWRSAPTPSPRCFAG